MRFGLFTTIVGAIGVTAFALASSAQASSPGTVQVPGTRLAAALVPASAFGPDASAGFLTNSGSRLVHGRARTPITALSCYLFTSNYEDSGISGETAWADEDVAADLRSDDIVASYEQAVHQFATRSEAAAYYRAAQSKFGRCRSFTIPDTNDNSVHETLRYLTRTRIDGHPAFLVAQLGVFTGSPSDGHLVDYDLITVKGTDVFMTSFHAQTTRSRNAPPEKPTLDAIIGKLISRVSALRLPPCRAHVRIATVLPQATH